MRIRLSNVERKPYTLMEGITPMAYVETEKNIGVTIDTKLSFEQHMCEKVNKVNSIMVTMEYMDINSFKLLYTSLVRPHIEYANQVWCPHLKKQIEAIVNVRQRATKQVPGLSTLTYEEILRKLKLPTLSYRRSRGDMKLPTLSYRRSRGDMKLSTLSYRRSHGDMKLSTLSYRGSR